MHARPSGIQKCLFSRVCGLQYEVPPNQPPAEAAPPPPKVYDGPRVANSYRAQDVTYDSRIVV